MKILVIDDKANEETYHRKALLEALKQQKGIEYQLIEPTPEALADDLTKVEDGEYDLIIVDYLFDKSRSIFKTGTSLYSLFRSYTKSTPIYLISVNGAPTNQIGDFELFVEDDLIGNHSVFEAEIESHTLLKSCNTLEDFLGFIECPEEVKEDIEAMVAPKILYQQSPHTEDDDQIPAKEIVDSLNLRQFKWLAQSLLRKEGPLLSNAGAAALLGISDSYFESISDQFGEALYTGIFNQSFDNRWWRCLLEDVIYSKSDPEGLLETLPFKEAASRLLGTTEESEYSICAKCEMRYPDGLGIVKDQGNELLPVHIACSEFNDTLPQEPFFRNPRIIEVE